MRAVIQNEALGVLQDITETRLSEKKIKQARQSYEAQTIGR